MHQAVNVYKDKRNTFLSAQIERLRQATTDSVAALTEMNLPGAIEVLENPITVPQVGK